MNDRMDRDVMRPTRQLRLGRQFAVENQIGGFKISTFFSDLLDRIPTIAQNAFIAVDIGDSALARGGIHKARVVADDTIVLTNLDLEQIRRLDRAVFDRNLVLFASPVVGYG